ncbi:MAG: 3-oxoacyl-[acyl-carrier-protein] reductase [Acidobacteriota bacterium]|nr:3-oxoacyl-[acyl-carrier-protein] reductase [Acidobacteriota bacterium]MDQ5873516.1 3-oxoacyl-[acyl-carrier-protein] reductase [Acidobacteriota bacterium]
MNRFDGRIALVTGASRGIGEAIARRLAAEGAIVLAAARSTSLLNRVVADIAKSGGRARVLELDVSDPASIEAAMKGSLEEFGQIDVLVNNAGIAEDNLILRMSREAWDRVLMTNLTGAFLLIQAVVKNMVRRRYGRIVNVTSVVGLMGNAGQANYAAAKAGLVGLTRSVARELGSRNITCNAVAPGFIATAMTDRMTEQAREALSGQIPLQRLGAPDDVAGAVAFLASEDAAYVTGAVLNVSGGLYM